MHQAKKQHFKVKFWNWDPLTIWHIMPFVQFFFKTLHPIVLYSSSSSKESKPYAGSLKLWNFPNFWIIILFVEVKADQNSEDLQGRVHKNEKSFANKGRSSGHDPRDNMYKKDCPRQKKDDHLDKMQGTICTKQIVTGYQRMIIRTRSQGQYVQNDVLWEEKTSANPRNKWEKGKSSWILQLFLAS